MQNKRLWFAVFAAVIFVLLPLSVSADIGPRDKLTVCVINPPGEPYYLDLLTQNSSTYENFHKEGEREALNQEMLALLYTYAGEGWKPALTEGTGVPMWGDLVGKADGTAWCTSLDTLAYRTRTE